MTITLKDINIESKLPEQRPDMPVFKLVAPSLEDRRESIEVLSEILDLKEKAQVQVRESLHMVSESGEIQFYKPSGALWGNNSSIELENADEQRQWDVEKIRDPDDPSDIKLVLAEKMQMQLREQATDLFRKTNLLPENARFADIELDQVARLDAEGKEIDRFAGEANARFLYQVEGINVDGPGAKTYAFYNPGERSPELTGIYHAWREIEDAISIDMPSMEEVLETAISKDRELEIYSKKGYGIKLAKIDLVYFALPPFKYQDYLIPVLHVVGSAKPGDKEAGADGFEFAKFYNAVLPVNYAKRGIYADYLVTNL